jgi:hypothetical protein
MHTYTWIHTHTYTLHITHIRYTYGNKGSVWNLSFGGFKIWDILVWAHDFALA